MKQYFVFNGHSSADFDLYINGGETYNFPERDVELLEIPGRSGALTVDNGRYKNVTLYLIRLGCLGTRLSTELMQFASGY